MNSAQYHTNGQASSQALDYSTDSPEGYVNAPKQADGKALWMLVAAYIACGLLIAMVFLLR